MCNLQIIIQAVPGSRSDCQVNTNEIVAFFMCLVLFFFFFEGGDLQQKERVFIHRDITVIRWHLRSTSRYWTNRRENKITSLYAYAMALLTAPNGFSINLIVTYFPLELETDLFWIGSEGNKIKNHRLQWWIKAKNCLGCQILYQ